MNKDIRSLRQQARLTLNQLATQAGVSVKLLRKCERGLILPSPEFFFSIAEVLDTDEIRLCEAQAAFAQNAQHGEGYATAVADSSFVLEGQDMPSTGVPVLDLFCGVGGFSYGFEQTGFFKVQAGLDLLPDRIKTFAANHPHARAVCGDVKEVDFDSLMESREAPEVIIGGPPCQGFSSVRPFRTLTEGDARNNLFEHFVLAVEHYRPKWFVMENVVGMITHKKGSTLRQVLALFAEIGYKVDWRVLNAATFGLPQRRERTIIVGNRVGVDFQWMKPTHYLNGFRSMAGNREEVVHSQLPLFADDLSPALTVMDAIHDLPLIEAGQSASVYADVEPTPYEETMRDGCEQLTLHEATNHSERMLEIIRNAGSNRAALPDGMTTSGFSSCYSRMEHDAPSVTLTVNFVHPSSNKCIHPFQDRALTPREGARLQSFPDTFSFLGSRTQIVKQIGNAVPPLLGQVIAESIVQQWK